MRRLILLAVTFCSVISAISQPFSRKDSLRGNLTPIRTCYDVTFYDLFVMVDEKELSLERSYNIIHFNECKIPAANILGEKDMGFELINTWLDATRLTVAATSVSRAERAFDIALDWSANRKQFGKVIGKFQGVSFKLADMAMDIKLANLILMESAWKIDQGTLTSKDAAMAKLFCTEMIGRVSDEAIQICGGMGLMADIPLERIWRDARIERICLLYTSPSPRDQRGSRLPGCG